MTNTSTTIATDVYLCHGCSLHHDLGPMLGHVFDGHQEWLALAAPILGRFDLVDRHRRVVATETPCLVCGESGLERRYEHPAILVDGSAV